MSISSKFYEHPYIRAIHFMVYHQIDVSHFFGISLLVIFSHTGHPNSNSKSKKYFSVSFISTKLIKYTFQIRFCVRGFYCAQVLSLEDLKVTMYIKYLYRHIHIHI